MKKIQAFLCVILLISGTIFTVSCSESKSTQYYDSDIVEFYHDQAYVFMQPLEPTKNDEVTIRLRTLKGNVKDAVLRYSNDVDVTLTEAAKYKEIPMHFEKKDDTGYYEYFICKIPKQSKPYMYHFKLSNNKETIYVNNPYNVSVGKPNASTTSDFYVMPGFKTPDWAKGALWYSIMPDGFYNGEVSNDKLGSGNTLQQVWGVDHISGNDYLGGDMQGIIDKIDYLKELNVTGLFMNPIWTATHQAGYGSFDLMQIDSAFGNEEVLSSLVSNLHENDIRLMLDGVFKYSQTEGYLFNAYGLYPSVGAVSSSNPMYQWIQRDSSGMPILSWGAPTFDFSNPEVRKYIYSTENSVMQYYMKNFDVDGWRLDVGPDLSGSDPEFWGTAETIIKDMRKYVKGIDEDKFLLSEHGDKESNLIRDYTLDSKWGHFNFTIPIRDYMINKTSESVLMTDLYNGVVKLPRSIANCSYNYTSSHDLTRPALITNSDKASLLSGNLITMTYVGAPAIFYGNEIGLEGVKDIRPFGSFDWNERDWDYTLLSQQKTLGQLRADYAGIYKDGAYLTLAADAANKLTAFARFNESGTAITVTNSTDRVLNNITLTVSGANVKNNTVLTDYLTGNTYKVKDGKVTIDVNIGGAVLVQGAQGKTVNDLSISKSDNNTSSVIAKDTNTYELKGSGEIKGAIDNIAFASRPGFNNCEISAINEGSSGTYALLMRENNNDDSPFYGVSITNTSAAILSRQSKGTNVSTVKTLTIPKGATFKIKRSSDNTFNLLLLDGNNWQAVEGSQAVVPMKEVIRVGLAPLSGTSRVKDIDIVNSDRQLRADFSNNLGSMSTVYGDASKVTVSGGELMLSASTQPNFVLSETPKGDFTFKAKLLTKNGGIAAYSDAKNYLYISYKNENLVFGMVVKGNDILLASKPYSANSVELMFEKIGANYEAKYSEDGVNFTSFDFRANANYSVIKTGVFAQGEAAKFDYMSFGDGLSFNQPEHFGYVNLSIEQNAYQFALPKMKITSGEWEYYIGGYRNTTFAYSEMNIDGQWQTFKINAVIKPLAFEESGVFGIQFSEYAVVADASGNIRLTRNGTVLQSAKTENLTIGKDIRFSINVLGNGYISVLIGNEMSALINYKLDNAFTAGKINYFADGSKIHLGTHSEFHTQRSWQTGGFGSLAVESIGEGENASNMFTLSSQLYTFGSLLQDGVTDFLFASNIELKKSTTFSAGKFGLLIGGSAGSYYRYGGLMVTADTNKNIKIIKKDSVLNSGKDIVLSSVQADFDPASFYLMVVVQNKTIKVYIDKYVEENMSISTEPVLIYTDSAINGGTFNVYCEAANVTAKNVYVYGLHKSEDYKLLKPYLVRPIQAPPLPEPKVKDEAIKTDFSYEFKDRYDLAQLYKYGGGLWMGDENTGILKGISGEGNWDMGATIAAGITQDQFDFEFSIKKDGGNWAGILLNKSRYTDTHNSSGLMISLNGNYLVVYDGTNQVADAAATPLSDGFIKVKLSQRLVGGKHVIYVYLNGSSNEAFHFAIEDTGRPQSVTGFISLIVGNTSAQFKDLKYTKK